MDIGCGEASPAAGRNATGPERMVTDQGWVGGSGRLVPGTGVEPVRPRWPADFTYHHSFRYRACPARFVVWTISLPYAFRHLGRGRLASTLSHASHGLSSGSPSARPVKGSPNLTPVHPRVSPWGTLTSPLRLPVPPPGQAAWQNKEVLRKCKRDWRLRSESNRRTRLCRPLHNHSATQPGNSRCRWSVSGGKCLERETRLELATPTLARLCSTN